jgi:hypothetical protein
VWYIFTNTSEELAASIFGEMMEAENSLKRWELIMAICGIPS